MNAVFTALANALWVVSTVTVTLSFWIIQRNLRQALRGMAYKPTPLWIDRLDYGLKWLMFPLGCYQMVLFLKGQDYLPMGGRYSLDLRPTRPGRQAMGPEEGRRGCQALKVLLSYGWDSDHRNCRFANGLGRLGCSARS